MVTEKQILKIVNRMQPTSTKKIGDKLGLPKTNQIGKITKERSELIQLIFKMCEEGKLEWIEHQGVVLSKADNMNENQDEKRVLSQTDLRRVPNRALPTCQCKGEILVIARQYGGEHLWLECGSCYKRGHQAVSTRIVKLREQVKYEL